MDFPWRRYYHHEWTNSGTAALAMAIGLAMAARPVEETPEVILPAYGCPDLVAAVLFHGARPVLVDLAENSPHMDPQAFEKALGCNTVAVVAVSFLGLGENLQALKEDLRKSAIWLIEDSAQAFPPACVEHGVADCAVLSFGRGKPINLMGGGALLIHNDHSARARAMHARYPEGEKGDLDGRWHMRRQLFNLLLTPPLYGLLLRFPFLGIGATRFHPLEKICRERPREAAFWGGVAEYRTRPDWAPVYRRELKQAGLADWVDLTEGRWPEEPPGREGSLRGQLLRYPLLAPDRQRRDQALAALNRAGFGANAFYNEPLPAIEGLEQVFGVPAGHFPNACNFADRLITLPSHHDVRERDVQRMVAIISSANASGQCQ